MPETNNSSGFVPTPLPPSGAGIEICSEIMSPLTVPTSLPPRHFVCTLKSSYV